MKTYIKETVFNMDLNGMNIYFGKVVDVEDPNKLNRIRVSIKSKTDQLPIDKLAWYYPFFGINYIPIKDDEVPILIVNNDFTLGFYNPKINLSEIEFEGTEYENYLEIYKRLGVQLSYNESDGIQFINQASKVQVEDGRVSLFVEDNQITLDEKRIDLGTDGQPAPLGDDTVETFQKTHDSLVDTYDKMIDLFEAVLKGCVTPETKGIKIALTALLPSVKQSLPPKYDDLNTYLKTIRSEKTFIE